jgi:IPT/TIG domain
MSLAEQLGPGAAASGISATLRSVTQTALLGTSAYALSQASTTSPPSTNAPTSTTLSTSTTATTTAPAAPLLDVHGTGALWLIGVVVIVVAGIAFAPTIVDAWRAATWRTTLTNELTSEMHQGRISHGDLRTLLGAIAEPRGVRGLTRSLIALLVVVLATFALAVTAFSGAPDAIDLRKTIVTSLLTVLATVAGFYFGSRTAQTSAEDARRANGTAARQGTVPAITQVDPNHGKAGITVTIRGSGLTGASVLFGSTPATAVTPGDDTHLTAEVPPLPAGAAKTVPVIAVTATGRSAPTPEAQFTYD